MAYTGKKPIDHTDVTQSQSMTVTDDLTVDTNTLHVDSTNNKVGIGTTSVDSDCDRLQLDSDGTNTLKINGTGTRDMYSYHDTGGVGWATGSDTSWTNLLYLQESSNEMKFYTSGALRMTIDSSGYITSLPTYNNGSASSANMVVNSNGLFLRSVSARKYKTDIEDVEASYAEALYGLRSVYYRSTLDADNSDHSHWGFIAEEVAAIDPRLVHYKTVEVTHNEEGVAVETELDTPVPEGVQYERFVPLLLKLITDQKDRIGDLETKVATLETENADFETRIAALEAAD